MSTETRLNVQTADGRQQVIAVPPQEHPNHSLADVLRRSNLPLNTRCGQRGLCDGCIVDLLSGTVHHSQTHAVVSANGSPATIRACEHRLPAGYEIAIHIPARSALAYAPHVVTDFRINVPSAHAPLWQQVPVAENGAIEQKDGLPLDFTPEALRQRAATPQANWATCERLVDRTIVTGFAGARTSHAVGVAVDIGTTTVALLLVDLANGKTLAKASAFNHQMRLGDDVLTRINLISGSPAALADLHRAIVSETIAPLLRDALAHAGRSHDDVKSIVFAGNTTMLHLLANIDPSPMGVAPFTPVFIDHIVKRADEIEPDGFSAAGSVHCHLLPGAAAYVGADITAGVLASGLLYDAGPSLLVDVGTNGEIVLKTGDTFLGCATAAGPAFEGAGLSAGIRAGDGAISHVRFSGTPLRARFDVINASPPNPPIGICGSAYIDFLAESRRINLLGPSGRFEPESCPDAAGHLVQTPDGDHAFRLAYAQGKRPLLISQRDVAQLLQAKAAIAAGILTLLDQTNLAPADIKTVYLAGGFGTHMNVANAIAMGLLPSAFRPDQVQPVGNTSLAGAYLALMDSTALSEIARLSKRIQIVELNLDPRFEDHYIDQLSLP